MVRSEVNFGTYWPLKCLKVCFTALTRLKAFYIEKGLNIKSVSGKGFECFFFSSATCKDV